MTRKFITRLVHKSWGIGTQRLTEILQPAAVFRIFKYSIIIKQWNAFVPFKKTLPSYMIKQGTDFRTYVNILSIINQQRIINLKKKKTVGLQRQPESDKIWKSFDCYLIESNVIFEARLKWSSFHAKHLFLFQTQARWILTQCISTEFIQYFKFLEGKFLFSCSFLKGLFTLHRCLICTLLS